MWDIINVVILYWKFKIGSGLCKWWVKCTLLFLHAACIRFICCVPSDKGCGGQSCMLGLETLYSTWVPDQDETPHIFILNRAMGLYCRGCRQFCLYILCWRAHYRRKVKKMSVWYFDLFLNFSLCISVLVDWGYIWFYFHLKVTVAVLLSLTKVQIPMCQCGLCAGVRK